MQPSTPPLTSTEGGWGQGRAECAEDTSRDSEHRYGYSHITINARNAIRYNALNRYFRKTKNPNGNNKKNSSEKNFHLHLTGDPLEKSKDSWRLLEIPGELWRFMETIGDSWRGLETCGNYWRFLGKSRDSWRIGDSWRSLVTHGNCLRCLDKSRDSKTTGDA